MKVSNHKIEAINMKGSQSLNYGIFAVPAPGKVTIDADLSDWDLSGITENFADIEQKDVMGAKTAAMWDEDNLYLAIEFRDPYPLNNQFDPMQDLIRHWKGGSTVLRVLAGIRPAYFTIWAFQGDKAVVFAEYHDVNDNKQNLRWDGPISNHVYYNGEPGNWDLGGGVELAYCLAEDGQGYTQELKLPWSVVFGEPKKMTVGESIRCGIEYTYGNPSGKGLQLHNFCDNMRPGYMSTFFRVRADNWGDITCIDHTIPPEEKRIYRRESEETEGTIPLRVQVPADAKTFSVTINTPDGLRVRNVAGGFKVADYTVEEKDGLATVEILWDGLDETGKMAPAGEYVLKGVTANGVEGYYEGCFYNPGIPAWKNKDNTGSWGADHFPVQVVAAAGDCVTLACCFAEGGFATFGLNLEGEKAYQKRWSEIRGADAMAMDEQYVYTVPNDWADSGVSLLRMDAKTGAYVPYVKDGEVLPMPYSLKDMLGVEEIPVVTAMCMCGQNKLLLRCTEGNIRLVNLENATQERLYPLTMDDPEQMVRFGLKEGTRFTARKVESVVAIGNAAYYDALGKVIRMDLETGVETVLPTPAEKVNALATDGQYLYVADSGKNMQVIKCTAEGEEISRFGKQGGRARTGVYQRDGMLEPDSIAVDSKGYLWVCEHGTAPRRVSVWAPDGAFFREYLGNAGYCGQGTVIHTHDPNKAWAENCEYQKNPETGEWEVVNVIYNPDPEKGLDYFDPGAATPFDCGSTFYSSASGEKREYFAALGWPERPHMLMFMKQGDTWIPCAGLGTVSGLQNLIGGRGYKWRILPHGEFADCDPSDYIFWNDYNGDGYVTRDECVIVPSSINTLEAAGGQLPVPSWWLSRGRRYTPCYNTNVSQDDLSFYLNCVPDSSVCEVKPVGFRDGGIPIYLPEGVKEMTREFTTVGSAEFIPGQDLVVGFIQIDKQIYVAGWRKSDCKVLWKYISPYHEVHGSHAAPMPKPGLLIGCLKVAGHALDCGEVDTIMIRGNLGEDYFLTTQGEYIGILTRDGRLPGLTFPDDEETLRKVNFAAFSGRGEHFSGRFTKHTDGVVRCHGGLPATEAGNIVRIEGLDRVKRFAPVTIHVSDEELVRAAEDNQARALEKLKKPDPIEIVRGNDWSKAKVYEIAKPGQNVQTWFRALYDDEGLSLRYTVKTVRWVNGGANWQILFKTGDCVDFQLSPSANVTREPAHGDFRLLAAPFQGENIAVLMRQKDDTADGSEKYTYSSPVMAIPFDTVRRVEQAQVSTTTLPDGVQVDVRVPWAALNLNAPTPGTAWTGDVGVIVADALGMANAARIYRNNPSTGLVNDQPGEARIVPNGFGEMVFGG